MKILLSLEAAELEVKDMYGQKPVHQIRRNQSASRSQPPAAAPQLTCYRCGGNHKANKCSFKDAECHFCHKKGHISTVCRNKLKQQGKSKPPPRRTNQVETQEGTESPEYSLFHFHPEGSLPFTVQISVNKSLLTMEVDTGATLSLISQATYRKLWTKGDAPPLHRTEARLKSYAGEPIAVEGSINVDVKYLDQYASLPLLVVTGDGPSLLGRDWLKHFKLDWSQLNSVKRDHDASIQQLLDRHPALFKDELGKLEGETAKIYIDSDAKPQFYRARQVPYTLKVQVEAEIDRLVKEGVIEPVQFSEWAAPVVPVLKRDGSVRLCGDYKLTVNRAAKTDTYPLPRIEDLFASLAGGTVFSKLDLAQAYLQVPLDEASKKYVTVNTHRGLFQYNRLPFGVASTPSIFHRIMENVLQGLTGVCAYLDDILVSGKTPEDHMQNLEAVLERLEQAGLRLKRAKCLFMFPSVEYLGFQISAKGLQPTSEKVRAVQNAPAPTDVSQLKSFVGLVNYYGKFLPDLSHVLAPLYRLLQKSAKWVWEEQQQKAFKEVKSMLTSDCLLAHFDPTEDLVLACNASPYGVGAVLSHRYSDGQERPIAFASRSLGAAEKKYSQLEKEGLAIVFGVKKFHMYLFGRHFEIVSDHKPLQHLFHHTRGTPTMASARIQRWALTLGGYDYSISYKPGDKHGNADLFSRLPLGDTPKTVPDAPETILLGDYSNHSSQDQTMETLRSGGLQNS